MSIARSPGPTARRKTLTNGSVRDMVPSHDAAQKCLYVADGRTDMLNRQGNLYTSEVGYGRRVQKFALVSF